MSLFENLNDNVLLSVLSEWLQLKDLAKCSTCYCNKIERIYFENLIGNNFHFATNQVIAWNSNEDLNQWNWLLEKRICLKNIKMENIETNQLLAILSNLQNNHISNLNFINVKPSKATGELLINFINNCKKLKQLRFAACDLLEETEFVSKINLQELTHLTIENCNTMSVNNKSAESISNTAHNLTHFYLFKMSLEYINSIILHNYKSIIEFTVITDAIEIATQTQIDSLFASFNKLERCMKWSLSYEGNLSTLPLSNILSFYKMNRNINQFKIYPINKHASQACFYYFLNSLHGIHDVSMIHVNSSTDDLLEFFSLTTVYRWILLFYITGISSQVIERIGTHSNGECLTIIGCENDMNSEIVTTLQKYFQPISGTNNWDDLDSLWLAKIV
jgi:hypothetical protein